MESPKYEAPVCSYVGGCTVVNSIGNAIATPDKLGTSPFAHDGSNGNNSGKRKEGVESRK